MACGQKDKPAVIDLPCFFYAVVQSAPRPLPSPVEGEGISYHFQYIYPLPWETVS
jgi:hypothetical protein